MARNTGYDMYGPAPAVGHAKDELRKQGFHNVTFIHKGRHPTRGPVLVFEARVGRNRHFRINVGRFLRSERLDVRSAPIAGKNPTEISAAELKKVAKKHGFDFVGQFEPKGWKGSEVMMTVRKGGQNYFTVYDPATGRMWANDGSEQIMPAKRNPTARPNFFWGKGAKAAATSDDPVYRINYEVWKRPYGIERGSKKLAASKLAEWYHGTLAQPDVAGLRIKSASGGSGGDPLQAIGQLVGVSTKALNNPARRNAGRQPSQYEHEHVTVQSSFDPSLTIDFPLSPHPVEIPGERGRGGGFAGTTHITHHPPKTSHHRKKDKDKKKRRQERAFREMLTPRSRRNCARPEWLAAVNPDPRNNPGVLSDYDPREEQLRAQIASIFRGSLEGGESQEHLRAKSSRAFAIATGRAHKYGWLYPGTRIPTPKAIKASKARYAGTYVGSDKKKRTLDDLINGRQTYEIMLGLSRKGKNLYRVTEEPTEKGPRYFVWPIALRQALPGPAATARRIAEKRAARLNASGEAPASTERTGFTKADLAHWLPPLDAFAVAKKPKGAPAARGSSSRSFAPLPAPDCSVKCEIKNGEKVYFLVDQKGQRVTPDCPTFSLAWAELHRRTA